MRVSAAMTAALILGFASSARASEPWSDNDPDHAPTRLSLANDIGVRAAAEYRANAVWIRPLDLNGTRDRNFSQIEHRLRLDAGVDYDDKVRLVSSVDVLDGVLWGDNGTLGIAPEPTSGSNVATVNPNISRSCIALRPGEPSTTASSYGYGLCPADPIYVRRLYGDIVTPIGLFRIGRQAFTEGATIAVNDGDGRKNRFGFANRGNSADRVLFATKPLEAFHAPSDRDRSETKGAFLILAYDRLVTDDPQKLSDDLHGVIAAVRYLDPDHDRELRAYYSYRFSGANDTGISAVGFRAISKFGDFSVGAEGAVIAGSTREIGDAFRVITNDPPVAQTIRQFGARAVGRYDRPKFSLYLETDYASGDSDPEPRTPLTQYRFAEDTNVGLLMFKRALAYQTGRAAAAGVALLRDLKAPSFPIESIDSRGSFTNAFAIFPQADYRPIENLLLRAGVLVAWAPSKVVDPIASLQHKDGLRIDDDLINFAGGKPKRFYGTEVDMRVQYRLFDHFAADLEGAVLFPGSAFQDANGDAVNSWLLQGRGTFFF